MDVTPSHVGVAALLLIKNSWNQVSTASSSWVDWIWTGACDWGHRRDPVVRLELSSLDAA
jgi:hypothetical protein